MSNLNRSTFFSQWSVSSYITTSPLYLYLCLHLSLTMSIAWSYGSYVRRDGEGGYCGNSVINKSEWELECVCVCVCVCRWVCLREWLKRGPQAKRRARKCVCVCTLCLFHFFCVLTIWSHCRHNKGMEGHQCKTLRETLSFGLSCATTKMARKSRMENVVRWEAEEDE